MSDIDRSSDIIVAAGRLGKVKKYSMPRGSTVADVLEKLHFNQLRPDEEIYIDGNLLDTADITTRVVQNYDSILVLAPIMGRAVQRSLLGCEPAA